MEGYSSTTKVPHARAGSCLSQDMSIPPTHFNTARVHTHLQVYPPRFSSDHIIEYWHAFVNSTSFPNDGMKATHMHTLSSEGRAETDRTQVFESVGVKIELVLRDDAPLRRLEK